MLLLLPIFAWGQQANVNLDYNLQKNTENLVPFSAPFNSPDVNDDRKVTFRLKAPSANNVQLTGVVSVFKTSSEFKIIVYHKNINILHTQIRLPMFDNQNETNLSW